MQEKVQKWKGIVDTKNSQRAIQEAADIEAAQKRLDAQRDYHTLITVKKMVAPGVREDLREQLKKVFADERKAHEYIQRIFRRLT